MNQRKHVGSSFDDFLSEEAVLEETPAVAIKRVVAWQIQEMRAQRLTKTELAERMHNQPGSTQTRSNNPSVTRSLTT